MSELRITGAIRSYGPVHALREANLTVPSGSFTAILGPSGCGKTTLLRCVAGLDQLDAGVISLDDRPITDLPAHRRRIAIVPQEGALFPHLTVAANIGYGLNRIQRRGPRIAELLDLVGLAGHGDRWPHELSGGQQQRVAVARALAPRPALVLLDEPFSALDAALRTELRQDVRRALRADGATAVLVTHDQDEALSTADQVAVMRAGTLVQSGSPTEIYRRPTDEWVARFVGEAVALPAVGSPAGALTALGAVAAPGHPQGAFTVLVRPEQIALRRGAAAVVTELAYHGHDSRVRLLLADGTEVIARVPAGVVVAPGERVGLEVRGQALLHRQGSGPERNGRSS
ncbi:ABC transporter ATP-binding protein [Crossiella sp. CA198]|uniref:ABC transporter ATP-binding protein n=1 Tax=Crossiella sp. CA198 TaxID=3455607 RepID=UPI003F8D5DE4